MGDVDCIYFDRVDIGCVDIDCIYFDCVDIDCIYFDRVGVDYIDIDCIDVDASPAALASTPPFTPTVLMASLA